MSSADPTSPPQEIREALKDPERILQHYVLSAKLASGGMGTVWKAWDTKLHRWVAVKSLNLVEEESLARFRREAQLTAQLRHPNIASIYDVGEDRGRHFIVMEFIDGRSLSGVQLAPRRAAEIVRDAARATRCAHEQGILHRDLKPANLMEGKNGHVYVTDFGLAKHQKGESALSVSGMVIGTPNFMPPEQAQGRVGQIDARSDVYSLGATLYSLLTGCPPFTAENTMGILMKVCLEDPIRPSLVAPAVSPALEAIVLKAMEKRKERRYGSAASLAEDLDHYLHDREVRAKPHTITRRVFRSIRRHRLPILVGVTAIALLVSLVAVFSRKGLPPPAPPPEPTAEELWRRRFDPIQRRLSFAAFKDPPEAAPVIAEMPAALGPEIEQWLQGEIQSLPVPGPKKDWWANKASAARIVRWCGCLEALFGSRFSEMKVEFERIRAAFAPIADYRGVVTLKLHLLPSAELRTLRVGEQAVILEGKVIEESGVWIGSEVLETPLVIYNLEIGPLTLELVHPTLGTHSKRFSAEGLVHEGTYWIQGSLTEPDGIRLRLP